MSPSLGSDYFGKEGWVKVGMNGLLWTFGVSASGASPHCNQMCLVHHEQIALAGAPALKLLATFGKP